MGDIDADVPSKCYETTLGQNPSPPDRPVLISPAHEVKTYHELSYQWSSDRAQELREDAALLTWHNESLDTDFPELEVSDDELDDFDSPAGVPRHINRDKPSDSADLLKELKNISGHLQAISIQNRQMLSAVTDLAKSVKAMSNLLTRIVNASNQESEKTHARAPDRSEVPPKPGPNDAETQKQALMAYERRQRLIAEAEEQAQIRAAIIASQQSHAGKMDEAPARLSPRQVSGFFDDTPDCFTTPTKYT